MFQQRWRSKRLLRGYHGDWIPERRFKRWFLPSKLPFFSPHEALENKDTKGQDAAEVASHEQPVPPVSNLFLRDIERRLDVVVFRCCFARSAYHGRMLVLHGKVSINGQVVTDPGRLLEPGDLITVEPKSVPMLDPHIAKYVQKDRERFAPCLLYTSPSPRDRG